MSQGTTHHEPDYSGLTLLTSILLAIAIIYITATALATNGSVSRPAGIFDESSEALSQQPDIIARSTPPPDMYKHRAVNVSAESASPATQPPSSAASETPAPIASTPAATAGTPSAQPATTAPSSPAPATSAPASPSATAATESPAGAASPSAAPSPGGEESPSASASPASSAASPSGK